jgi:C-terminal processing protease CtpA/Prc
MVTAKAHILSHDEPGQEVTRVPDEDGIHQILLTRTGPSVPWGFRLSGGQDEGISLKLSKVALESPSGRAGLLPKDLLVSVQGQNVLDRSHDEVVRLVKNSGLELRMTVERGENLIPNMALLARPEDLVRPEKKQNVYLQVSNHFSDLALV